jgi:hypothetical protein
MAYKNSFEGPKFKHTYGIPKQSQKKSYRELNIKAGTKNY